MISKNKTKLPRRSRAGAIATATAVAFAVAVGRGATAPAQPTTEEGADALRTELYGEWLEAARNDDFIGVQNYERVRYDANGRLPPPADARVNYMGAEIFAPSLGGAVRYAHRVTGIPVIVTEHGIGLAAENEDDTLRAAFIPEALAGLKAAIDDGVPVKGYVHWSLLDNFEWIFGYRPRFGLVAVDRRTFARKPKPSAAVYAAISQRNAL